MTALRRLLAGLCCVPALQAGAEVDRTLEPCRFLAVTERDGTAGRAGLLLPRITIEESGRFCLDRDVRQAPLVDRLRARPVLSQAEAMVRIRADNVSLDLAGHAVSNAMPHGMTIIWFSRFAPGRRGGARLRHARIRNGVLSSPGARGVGIDLTASRPYGARSLQLAPVPAGSSQAELFADTGHLIEGMIIEAGKRAIQLDGRNNIIRNNRIVIDGSTAIIAQGPGIVIENNLIEVRNRLEFPDDRERRLEAAAPFSIRLIQANGAIVRNNRIRLIEDGDGKRLPAAIELVQSTGVRIEGNLLAGMERLVSADPASDYREAGNREVPCLAGRARFLAPDESGGGMRARSAVCR